MMPSQAYTGRCRQKYLRSSGEHLLRLQRTVVRTVYIVKLHACIELFGLEKGFSVCLPLYSDTHTVHTNTLTAAHKTLAQTKAKADV